MRNERRVKKENRGIGRGKNGLLGLCGPLKRVSK